MAKNVVVHKDPEVKSLIQLFDGLISASHYHLPIQTHLNLLSQRLVEGHQNEHHGIGFLVHRKFGKKTLADIFSSAFSLDDARDCVAQEFGYKRWFEVTQLEQSRPDAGFEQLVDRLLAGDLKEIRNAIAFDSSVVHQHSCYPHQCTLLHYSGSNGVEGYRQVVPENLVEIVETLLAAGADTTLKAQVYGGCTAKELMKTSKHPYDAGLSAELEKVFNHYEDH